MKSRRTIVNPLTKTASPSLNCSNTGKWDNKLKSEQCKSCLKKSQPGYPYFYCDGNCTSEYELGGPTCSTGSLVAKTKEQCDTPCYQGNAPKVSGGCQDDYDCGEGNKCISKNVIGGDGIMHKNRGICEAIIKDKEGYYDELEYFETKNNTIMNIDNNPNINFIDYLNNITTSNSWKISLHEINDLTCEDIKDLVKLKIETSKKEGNYEIEREQLISSLDHVNKNPKIIDNTFNILETAIENINCTIKEIHKQYDIDNKDRLSVLTRANNTRNCNKCNNYLSKNFKTGSFITIGILSFIIIVFVYLYIRQKQFNNM